MLSSLILLQLIAGEINDGQKSFSKTIYNNLVVPKQKVSKKKSSFMLYLYNVGDLISVTM